VRVAGSIEARLKQARTRLPGPEGNRDYVQVCRPTCKRSKARRAGSEGPFRRLREGVDDKKSDLAQKLAALQDASDKGATALQELKDAHKA